MWLLSFLPDSFLIWVINIILIAGLTGTFSSFFLKFIPPLQPYAIILKYTGIALLVIGVWFRGGYDVEMTWRAKVNELNAKIAISEQQSKEANTKLSEKLQEKTKIIKEVQIVIKERIKEVEKKIDAQCVVAPEAISILNDAARNVKGDSK